MDDPLSRRNFISRSATIASGAALAAGAMAAKKPHGDVKLSLYTITYLGYWYRGEALSMEQIIQRSKSFGYQAIEIEGKRPHGCPLDWPRKRCLDFKKRIADAGLALAGVAADNDFSSPISEHREAQLCLVRDLIRMTADLDAKILRVLMAWPGATVLPGGGGRYDIAQKIWDVTHEDYSETQAWNWCRECFVEVARYAGEHGVILALQNHKPIIKNYRQVLQMVKEVGSPHLKVCLDAPLFESTEPAYLAKAVHEAGALQVQTHFGWRFERGTDGRIRRPSVKGQWRGPYLEQGYMADPNYEVPFIKALFEIGYEGYMGYELCSPLPVIDGKTVGLEFVDTNVQLAAEHAQAMIAEAKKQAMVG